MDHIKMKFRSFLAIVLVCLATCTYVVYPWPLPMIFGTSTTIGGNLLCIILLAASAFLLWSTLPQPRIEIAGKAVFITGCDSGFGKELAGRLDRMGFLVFAGCLAPDREGAMSLKEASSSLRIVPIDVTDDFQVMKAMQYVKENLGENQLWAIVNNAGVAMFCEIEWCSVREFMNIMDINVFGIVRVTKAFLPLLRRSEGRVVNVASLAGRYTLPAFSAYSMSKKACIAFSDCLRQEMRKFNIMVITVEPGLYRTPIISEDSLISKNKKSWAETPTDVKEDYGEEYFDHFLNLITVNMKAAREQTHEVTDHMIEAVCAVKPYFRYVPYWRNRLRAFIIESLPTKISDKLFALRFPTKEPSLKKNKSPMSPLNSAAFDKIQE